MTRRGGEQSPPRFFILRIIPKIWSKLWRLHYAWNIGKFRAAMAEVTTKICGVTFESFFKKAIIFKDARCDEMAQKCLEAYASYGLRPAQISVRTGDQTFNYELSFSLFNGNGTFRISAEKMDVILQNATSDKDLEIVQDCIAKIYEHVPLPEIANTLISGDAHAVFPSVEELQQYLLKYANPVKQISSGGVIAYVNCLNWKEEIRFSIDKSLTFPAGLFLAWSTSYRDGKPSREVLKNVEEAFEASATKFDLTFPPKN